MIVNNSYTIVCSNSDRCYKMTPNRRAFLRTLGAGSIGITVPALFSGSAAAATIVTVQGGGYDIWSTEDAFHFYYQEVSGDFDVVVHNSFLEDTSSYAKAGIMVRETLDADARNVMLRRVPSNDAALQWRPDAGEDTVSTTAGGEEIGEVSGGNVQADWLRLRRQGDAIEAFGSTDGNDWTRIGRLTADEIDLSTDAYVGLPVTSHNVGTLCTAEYRALSGLSPDSNRDIGPVEVAGSVSVAEGVPVVSTESATDVTATSAALHGSLEDLGDASSADVSFEYREAGADEWTATDAETLSAPGSFSREVSGLSPQQEYEYRAVAVDADGDEAVSTTASFETPSIVRIESVTGVDADSATFHGAADLHGISSAEVSFQYRELNVDSWSASAAETITSSGSFERDVSDLTSRRYYEVRAALDADGIDTVTSDPLRFATPSHADGGESEAAAGPSSASRFDPADGFADVASWLDDDTPVIVVREPTREQLATALSVDGERLIVFETSGSIDLEGGIGVHNDEFYIAGQTAPSPGITLVRGGLFIDADDCVIQHIRIRRGDDTSSAGDAVGTERNRRNVIFDHVTAAWGTDETLSAYGENVTISNCIVSEALRNSDFHQGGNGHSAGSLIGSGYENFAMMGNLWASNLTRNPRLQSGTSVVVNNVSYDFRNAIGCSSETTASIVGNAYIRGDVNGPAISDMDTHEGEIYAADNYARPEEQPLVADGINRVNSPPVWPEGLEALSADEVEEHVFENAGARPANRTYHDRRIVRNVANWEPTEGNLPGGSGLDHAWIDHEEIIGDYPELPENTRSLSIPESGTRAWLGSWSRRVETGSTGDYEDEDGPGVVDDFEDGDLSEYVGATGHYEITTDEPVATGEYSLKNVSGSDALVSSHADLPRYPRAGDRFAAKVAATETTSVMGIAFGIESHENFYFVRTWNDRIQFYRVTEDEWSTPEYTKLAESDPIDVEIGDIYEYVVDWGTDGAIEIELQDADGETAGSVSATDSTHLYGGFGTRRTGMLDDVRIL